MRLATNGGLCVLSWLMSVTASAQLSPIAQRGPRTAAELRASTLIGGAIDAEAANNPKGTLAWADEAIGINSADPWAYYMRGDALAALGRVDEALPAFHNAEQRFAAVDTWGTSVAIWAEANALKEGLRCAQAAPVYERYAAFVERLDATAAAMARRYSKIQCAPLGIGRFNELDPAWESYHRGDALLRERKIDAAVSAYREAEQRFPESEAWGKSVAIWGQANALKEAGRCKEASPIYERYARFVEPTAPTSAAMGREYAKKQCVPVR